MYLFCDAFPKKPNEDKPLPAVNFISAFKKYLSYHIIYSSFLKLLITRITYNF